MIKRLKIKNFKSFKELDLELGKLNVVIGANASGKSNLVNAFGFLRDIARVGLEKAVQGQKGIKYLPNLNIGMSQNVAFEVTAHEMPNAYSEFKSGVDGYKLDINKLEYGFEIQIRGNWEFRVVKDEALFELDYSVYDYPKLVKHGLREVKEGPTHSKFKFTKRDGKVDFHQDPEILPDFLKGIDGVKLEPNAMLASRSPLYILSILSYYFRDFFVAEVDYKKIISGFQFAGGKELNEDADNLVNVLNDLLNDEAKKKTLLNLVKYALNFVEDVSVEEHLTGLIFKLKETYSKELIPQFLLSEGTINILALIIASNFQECPLLIFEEFTRAVHPHLISRIVNILKEVSEKKQVIVTTHNPEVLRYVDINDLLLVSRDKEGFSKVSRPADKEEVKIFLKNNIGIEDLYVKDLLRN